MEVKRGVTPQRRRKCVCALFDFGLVNHSKHCLARRCNRMAGTSLVRECLIFHHASRKFRCLSRHLSFHLDEFPILPKLSEGTFLWVCHRPSDRVSRAPVPSQGFFGESLSSSLVPGAVASTGSSVGTRGRTKVPMAVAWPERSSCSWRRPRRYRYSIRSTSERGRLACCRNSARTRASAPGFPRPARSSSRYKLRICRCSRLGRLMTAAPRSIARILPEGPPRQTVLRS